MKSALIAGCCAVTSHSTCFNGLIPATHCISSRVSIYQTAILRYGNRHMEEYRLLAVHHARLKVFFSIFSEVLYENPTVDAAQPETTFSLRHAKADCMCQRRVMCTSKGPCKGIHPLSHVIQKVAQGRLLPQGCHISISTSMGGLSQQGSTYFMIMFQEADKARWLCFLCRIGSCAQELPSNWNGTAWQCA